MPEANPTVPAPPNPDPEAPAMFGPRPEGWPADAPWPPPDMVMRDSGLVDSGAGNPATPTSASSSTPSLPPAGPVAIEAPLPSPEPSTPVPLPGLGPGSAEAAPPSPVAPESRALNPPPATTPPPAPATPDTVPVQTVDPATLEPHPYADLLPFMTQAEYRGLREAIRIDGQQVPGVMYAGKLLDGRNRCRACRELGIPFQVQPFFGTDQDALTFVLSVNQHRRHLNKSQRGAVATDLIPLMSEEINWKRIAKLQETYRKRSGGQTLAKMPESVPLTSEPITARAMAAAIMGVSDRYVGDALRLRREDPEAFAQARAGKLSLSAALRRMATASGAAAEQAARLRGLRSRFSLLTKRAATDSALLAKLEGAISACE